MLEQIAYESPRVLEQKQQVYVVGDLESLSASALYTGDLPPLGPTSTGKSGFGKKLGVGIGYVYDFLEIDNTELLLRIRADEDDKIGVHLNDEIIYDKEGRSKPILINNHLKIDWKDKKY